VAFLRSDASTLGAFLLVGLCLVGCAGGESGSQLAQRGSGGRHGVNRPVDPNDPLAPWVLHMREASERYDVPEEWIRAVMVRESGGRAMVDGRTITSPKGAIGLMQVMPQTYEIIRVQYGLGEDPSDPRDNIMAGTAYLREMYDQFGSPGFLAAYNCGPACYAGALSGRLRLPNETRAYLNALSPMVAQAEPQERTTSAAATLVAARPQQPTRVAAKVLRSEVRPAPVQVAHAPAPAAPPAPAAQVAPAPVRVAAAAAPPAPASPAPAPAPVVKPAAAPATAATPAHTVVAAAPQPPSPPVRPGSRPVAGRAPGVAAAPAQVAQAPASACNSQKGRVCVAQANSRTY
jgi:hypothetical protein